MKKLICISGWRRNGKDTIADYLVEKHGYKKLSLAEALKNDVCHVFNLNPICVFNDQAKDLPLAHLPVEEKTDSISQTMLDTVKGEFKNGHLTPRALCILLGSLGRAVQNDFWVNKVLAQLDPNVNYVIPDLRFQSELASLSKCTTHKAVFTRVQRFDTVDSVNASERDLDAHTFDYMFSNRSGISDLHTAIEQFLEKISK